MKRSFFQYVSLNVLGALAFFAAGPLVSLFNRDGDPALQQMAEQGLRLYFLGFPFAGLNLITASFLGCLLYTSPSPRDTR